ncbi:hypothetical protein IPA_07725 [Ignicoccus pacificus DSM 13166]|uniref:Uncharacterized protein n=1 Tax=Ignicoccus pacificus DSM 13166 TaxID=940294 RepID=A0A977PL63_9CREN|nr:hypothetical protein IPA_07725 [Ignicoccus pacificus DSM 13166]
MKELEGYDPKLVIVEVPGRAKEIGILLENVKKENTVRLFDISSKEGSLRHIGRAYVYEIVMGEDK